jgi:hypothetical protein
MGKDLLLSEHIEVVHHAKSTRVVLTFDLDLLFLISFCVRLASANLVNPKFHSSFIHPLVAIESSDAAWFYIPGSIVGESGVAGDLRMVAVAKEMDQLFIVNQLKVNLFLCVEFHIFHVGAVVLFHTVVTCRPRFINGVSIFAHGQGLLDSLL